MKLLIKKFYLTIMLINIMFISTGCSKLQPITDIPTSLLTIAPEQWRIPEPGDDTGVVHGVLLSSDDELLSSSIFLSRNLSYQNPEIPPTISLSFQNSPRGQINTESGIFYFENVEPGENYVISIMVSPSETIIVKENNREKPLMIAVKAGELIDLGVITVDYP